MRYLVLASGLFISLSALAEQVFFEPLGQHKTSGEITISHNANFSEITYNLKNVPTQKSYAIVIYENGSCSSYSLPTLPLVTEKDGKIAPYEWKFKNALLSLDWDIHLEKAFNHPKDPNTYSSQNERIGAMNGGVINNINFKNKVLVLEETDATNKPNGVGVACGIHP